MSDRKFTLWNDEHVTVDGRKAKIMKRDVKNERYPVVALITNRDGSEQVETYTLGGEVLHGLFESDLNLCDVPPVRKELWTNFYEKEEFPHVGGTLYDSEREAIRGSCGETNRVSIKFVLEDDKLVDVKLVR